jgi:hypothetical protein
MISCTSLDIPHRGVQLGERLAPTLLAGVSQMFGEHWRISSRVRWSASSWNSTRSLVSNGSMPPGGLHRGEVGIEAGEGRVPEPPVALDPVGRLAQRARRAAAVSGVRAVLPRCCQGIDECTG